MDVWNLRAHNMAKKLSKFDKQATLRSVPRPRLPYLRCFLVISRIPKLLCNCTPCATMFRRRRHAAYSSKTLFHNNCALRPTSGTSSSLPWLQPSGPLGGREEYSRAGRRRVARPGIKCGHHFSRQIERPLFPQPLTFLFCSSPRLPPSWP